MKSVQPVQQSRTTRIKQPYATSSVVQTFQGTTESDYRKVKTIIKQSTEKKMPRREKENSSLLEAKSKLRPTAQ